MAFKLAEAYVEMKSNTDPVIAGIGRVESSLKTATDKLKGFDTLLKISLGVGAGNLLTGLGQTLVSSVVAGLNDANSFAEGFLSTLMGMPTPTQQAAQAAEELRQKWEGVASAAERAKEAAEKGFNSTEFAAAQAGLKNELVPLREQAQTIMGQNADFGISATLRSGGDLINPQNEEEMFEYLKKLTPIQGQIVARWIDAERALQAANKQAADLTNAHEDQRKNAERVNAELEKQTAEWEAADKAFAEAQARQKKMEEEAKARGDKFRLEAETPEEKIAREATDIERSFRAGEIDEQTRDRLFSKFDERAGEEEKKVRQSPQFMALDQLSKSIQQQVNAEDPVPKKQLVTLEAIHGTLNDIKNTSTQAIFG